MNGEAARPGDDRPAGRCPACSVESQEESVDNSETAAEWLRILPR